MSKALQINKENAVSGDEKMDHKVQQLENDIEIINDKIDSQYTTLNSRSEKQSELLTTINSTLIRFLERQEGLDKRNAVLESKVAGNCKAVQKQTLDISKVTGKLAGHSSWIKRIEGAFTNQGKDFNLSLTNMKNSTETRCEKQINFNTRKLEVEKIYSEKTRSIMYTGAIYTLLLYISAQAATIYFLLRNIKEANIG